MDREDRYKIKVKGLGGTIQSYKSTKLDFQKEKKHLEKEIKK